MDLRLFRKLHSKMAPIVLIPFFVTAATGVTYRIGKSWFGWSRDQAHIFMVIHEGEYLGKFLEPIYVLVNGLALLWMLITGSAMLYQSISKSPCFKRLAKQDSAEDN
ncbi:MAG: PepSY domain-containing protein [Spirulinaceae cyanobacterium]